MSPISPDAFRRLFDFEKDAHAKTLASLFAVPEEKRASPEFRKAVDVMAHVVGARWLWLSRLGGTSERPLKFFSKEFPLVDLPSSVVEMETAWSRYLGGLNDAELSRAVEWGAAEGPRFTNAVEDLLTQLFGHSAYHRGQIALLLRQIDCKPAVTEFVYWARKPLSGG